MDIKNYIKFYQPNLYKLLNNNLNNNNFSQSYLISGYFSSPLLELSNFLAKLILCSNKKIDCDTCSTCKKFISNKNSLINLIILDGNQNTISKEDILLIEEKFSKTSIEKNNKFVYIINEVEHMTKEAINALLKFLEEPNKNVYAILTTKNIHQVIQTIISRCQILKLIEENKFNIYNDLQNINIDKKLLQILINFSILETDLLKLSKDKNLINLITNTIDYFENINDFNKSEFILLTNILPLLKSDYYSRFFLDLYTLFLNESIILNKNSYTILNNYENTLNKIYNNINNIQNILLNIYKLRKLINIHINITLLIQHINYLITKEVKND